MTFSALCGRSCAESMVPKGSLEKPETDEAQQGADLTVLPHGKPLRTVDIRRPGVEARQGSVASARVTNAPVIFELDTR